jgi:hypothetical protein
MKMFFAGMFLLFTIGANARVEKSRLPKPHQDNLSLTLDKVKLCVEQMDAQSTAAVDDDSTGTTGDDDGTDTSEGTETVTE